MRNIDAGPAGKILGAVAVLAALAWIAVETPRSLVATLGLVPILMLAALIWGPAMCRCGARLFSGSLYWPEVEGAPHAPLAALDAHIVAERWDIAEAQVRALCRQWPADPELWTRRVHLAWRQPVDVRRAREAHRALLAGGVDQAGYERLELLYLLLAESRLVDPVAIAEERLGCEERRRRWVSVREARHGSRERGLVLAFGVPLRRLAAMMRIGHM